MVNCNSTYTIRFCIKIYIINRIIGKKLYGRSIFSQDLTSLLSVVFFRMITGTVSKDKSFPSALISCLSGVNIILWGLLRLQAFYCF